MKGRGVPRQCRRCGSGQPKTSPEWATKSDCEWAMTLIQARPYRRQRPSFRDVRVHNLIHWIVADARKMSAGTFLVAIAQTRE
jgi:hypothetical protein